MYGTKTGTEEHNYFTQNIIPNEVMITGTVRVLKLDVLELISQRLLEIVEGIEKAFCVEADMKIKENNVPLLVNDESATDLLYDSAAKVLGDQNVIFPPPVMGSEDFALFTRAVPGSMMRIGCSKSWEKIGSIPLHSPCFDIDEAVLPIGVEIFADAVKMYL